MLCRSAATEVRHPLLLQVEKIEKEKLRAVGLRNKVAANEEVRCSSMHLALAMASLVCCYRAFVRVLYRLVK